MELWEIIFIVLVIFSLLVLFAIRVARSFEPKEITKTFIFLVIAIVIAVALVFGYVLLTNYVCHNFDDILKLMQQFFQMLF